MPVAKLPKLMLSAHGGAARLAQSATLRADGRKVLAFLRTTFLANLTAGSASGNTRQGDSPIMVNACDFGPGLPAVFTKGRQKEDGRKTAGFWTVAGLTQRSQ